MLAVVALRLEMARGTVLTRNRCRERSSKMKINDESSSVNDISNGDARCASSPVADAGQHAPTPGDSDGEQRTRADADDGGPIEPRTAEFERLVMSSIAREYGPPIQAVVKVPSEPVPAEPVLDHVPVGPPDPADAACAASIWVSITLKLSATCIPVLIAVVISSR